MLRKTFIQNTQTLFTFSFLYPALKLRPLAEFGDDIKRFIEQGEQYRKYMELKEEMEQFKTNLSIPERPRHLPKPTFKSESESNS